MNRKLRYVGMAELPRDLRDDCCDLCLRVNRCQRAIPCCAQVELPTKTCAGCASCERFKAVEFETGLNLIGRL
jgi:hypothetical protein